MLPVGMKDGAGAEAADRQLCQRSHRHVAVVFAGLHLDDIATAGGADRILQRTKALAGADAVRTPAILRSGRERKHQGQTKAPVPACCAVWLESLRHV